MNQNLLKSVLATVLLTGCSMISEPPSEGVVKVCTTMGFTSQIAIAIHSDTVLPDHLSAVINDEITVDECTSPSPVRYTFRRHNDHNATLTLFATPGSPVYNVYFGDEGEPYDLAIMHALVSGRSQCDADHVVVSEIEKPLRWLPVYANGEGCGLSGYTGF